MDFAREAMDPGDPRTALPVREFMAFHADPNINFQLNRFLIPGLESLFVEIGAKIRSLDDWKVEFLRAASRYEANDEFGRAAGLYRAAEFFISPGDMDRARAFEKFIELFYRSELGRGFERFQAPYEGRKLHGLRLAPKSPTRGTILVHGGFDSYAEEFHGVARALEAWGYAVVLFDGPGQGSTLMREKIPLTPQWQKPIAAVLDHLDLADVTLVGVSLGGGLALRAAAYEPRIQRVVACDVMLDLYQSVVARKGMLVAFLLDAVLALGWGRLLDRALRPIQRRDPYARWAIEQGKHVMGCTNASDFFAKMKTYNTRTISGLVRQDVLIMAGAEDHLVPLSQFFEQLALLTRARSVCGEIFTRADQAQSHCQIGNQALAVRRIAHWIEAHTRESAWS
jgi:pimeloyl-ACP methyl ester carboxylesterase